MNSEQDRSFGGMEGGETLPPQTFLCYRGSTTGSTAGLEIARCVRDAIGDDKEFMPVFFSESYHYDILSDLPQIFQSVRRVVIVLTVGFFDGFFVPSPDPETVLPREKDSITLSELRMAFSHDCELLVVFSGEFSWQRVDPVALRRARKYFGEANLDRLMHVSNPYVWKQAGNPPGQILERFRLSAISGVRRFLRELGPETDRSFETDITGFANRNNTAGVRSFLRDYISREDDSTAYPAFFLLQLMLRQMKEYEQMREVFDEFGSRFSSFRSYSHVWVLYLIECGENFDEEEALSQSWTDCVEFPDNAGFIHLFADVYATVCERADPEKRLAIARKWGLRAERMIDKALRLDPNYAKFYSTKARILALEKKYPEAERSIGMAIDKEISSRRDYPIRLMNYQYYRIMIQMDKRLDRLRGDGRIWLRVLQSLSGAGGERNEDLIDCGGPLLTLLDGSSSLVPMELDGRWFVHQLARELRKVPEGGLDARINCALERVSAHYRAKRTGPDTGDCPSAAGVFVLEREGRLEILALGDCTGIFFLEDGTAVTVTDDAVRRLDGSVLEACRALGEKKSMTCAEAVRTEEIRRLLRENRRKMNKPEGYRILSADMPPCREEDLTVLPADKVRRIVLFSDGFEAMAEELARPEVSLRSLYARLRRAEDLDPDFEKMPRFKPHDDASAVIAEPISL